MNRARLLAIGGALLVVSLTATACSSSSSTETTAPSSGGGNSSDGASVSNAVVRELQNTLATLEYYTGSVDGVYGPATTQAVEAFQRDAGIAVDGKYGPETHAALEKAFIETSNAWEDHKAIAELQQAMSDLGYYEGEVDGLYGPETVAGIKAVQKDCGLAEDGLYGPQTHGCLVDLGGDA
ncbi:peptidoglycan-binding protein [Actinomycetota bacterium]|jgi:peptidoglycan hydrolase-like protein with peptidoglycan-binding domain